jgi:hypothetical protein
LPRTVKAHTTTGIATKTRPRQTAIKPLVRAAIGSLLPPMSISALGIKLTPEAMVPQKQEKRPGQPHRTALTIVTIIPVWRVIKFLLIVKIVT